MSKRCLGMTAQCEQRVDDDELFCSQHTVSWFAEAIGLLSDYARIYPNNSGRTIRFLERAGATAEAERDEASDGT